MNSSRVAGVTASAASLIGLGLVTTWWAPVMVLLLLVVVVLHEYGHYATAKLTGMKATQFFVGFGPTLWSVQRGETEFGLKAFLVGGYVRIIGMSSVDEVEPGDEARSFRAQSYPRRVLVAAAGSLMHLLLALIVGWASLFLVGEPSSRIVQIDQVMTFASGASPAQRAGITPGDVILVANGRAIHSVGELHEVISTHVNSSVQLRVLRRGQTISVVVHPVDARRLVVDGQTVAPASGPPVGFIGVGLGNGIETRSAWASFTGSGSAVLHTATSAVSGVVQVFSPHNLSQLFHDLVSSRAASHSAQTGQRPVSGIGIVQLTVDSARAGWGPFLGVFVSLNVFIGIFNLFPVLPLDGGHIAIATYERLRSRKGQRYRADAEKLTPIVLVVVTALGLLFLATAYLDITHPIVNPFK
jgi:membrane-associated protease RseP (regulator of RpoE activity)